MFVVLFIFLDYFKILILTVSRVFMSLKIIGSTVTLDGRDPGCPLEAYSIIIRWVK